MTKNKPNKADIPKKEDNKVISLKSFKRYSILVGAISLSVGLLAGALVTIIGSRLGTVITDQDSGLPKDLNYSSVESLYDLIRKNYDGEINSNLLLSGLKRGLVESVGDPHTTYYNKSEAEQLMKSLNEGEFEGIGALITNREYRIRVISIIKDSPAEKAGLRPGDHIVAIDGTSTDGMSSDKAASLIRGEAGTSVKLEISRKQDRPFTVEIVRDKIKSLGEYYIEDGVGVLRLFRFVNEETTKLAQEAAAEFSRNNVKGIILDLRGNPGGILKETLTVVGLWLNEGDDVTSQKKGSEVFERHQAKGNGILAGIPTVVLIDGSSASASEIVAGALQDHKVATVVGVQSYGKGSVQDVLKLKSGRVETGELVKITIGRWFTPNGKTIDGVGITPDIVVEQPDYDDEEFDDLQFKEALEILTTNEYY